MKRYMKKLTGLVVEAWQVGDGDINELANWSRAYVVEEKDAVTGDILEALNVRTPEGMLRASQGMYVVKLNGHIFVSKQGAFEDKFEPLNEPEVDVVNLIADEEVYKTIGYISDEGVNRVQGPREI